MRRALARDLAAATGGVMICLAVVFAGAQNIAEITGSATPLEPDTASDRPARPEPARPESAAEPSRERLVSRGREVYAAQRCSACHSIAGRGSPRSPLDGVGRRLPRETIRLWIVAPERMRPGLRKPNYRHLPPEDIEALVEFLAGV